VCAFKFRDKSVSHKNYLADSATDTCKLHCKHYIILLSAFSLQLQQEYDSIYAAVGGSYHWL